MLHLIAVAALAQDAPVALVGARILPVSGPPIDKGNVVFQGGKILAVGADAAVPAGATVIDVAGKVVIPGLVDTHSHIATTGDLHEGGLTPGVSAIDAVDVSHPSVQRAQAGGVTTANVMPGSGTLIGGQTAYLKLRDANTVDALLYCGDRRSEVCGGLKMANGTNPRGDGGPDSRMGESFQQRNKFLAAKLRKEELAKKANPPADEKKKKKKDAPKPPEPPKPDLDLDPLIEVLDGKRIVHFHTHRADDIVTAIKLSQEFGFTLVLHHVSEAWRVADAIAAAGVMSSLIVIDSPGGKEEATEIRLENAAELEKRGALVALHTDDPITDSRLFLRSGALAMRAGLTEAGALAALTLNGAKMLGLDARIGSLDVGKDADLVVLSGDPFSVWTKVEQTWAGGAKVFDRSNPDDRLFATGGDEVGTRYPTVQE